MAEETAPTAVAAEDAPAAAVASLAISDKETTDGQSTEVDEVPSHRSHDPEKNGKRTDPFMFGQRYLTEEDNVFEYNAWDHVETDDAFKEYSEKQYELQRQAPVSDFDKSRFNGDPAKWWNLFYKNNTDNFFKDRKWLQQEFPILDRVCEPDAGPYTILEVGAGAGNTAFPILGRNKNPKLRVHACDFSKTAVQVMRENESYDTKYMQADVWDVAGTGDNAMPPDLGPGSVDVAILVFIFSALAPWQWEQAVANIARLVKPGGTVCFRDYGRGDLAQVRFRKGRYLEENFYIRGDGTRVYFFDKDQLVDIWTKTFASSGEGGSAANGKDGEADANGEPNGEPNGTNSGTTDGQSDAKTEGHVSASEAAEEAKGELGPFELEDIGVDRRLIVNRRLKLKMYRCWLQGRFKRRVDA